MKATEGKIGRVFVLSFDDGDAIPDVIEKFAAESGISAAYVAFNGGLVDGEVVSGAKDPKARPGRPFTTAVKEPRTVAAAGLLIADADGTPRLRLCGSLGCQGGVIAGGLRSGLKTWQGGEAVIYEIVGAAFYRAVDGDSGRLEILPLSAPAPHPAPEPADNASFIHAGDHTHLLYCFNAEFN
ncbi:MAG: DNA-binding protein [Planctomycetes bacterium]|nr:DNA-binding protein [Planctomycetota bacterium]